MGSPTCLSNPLVAPVLLYFSSLPTLPIYPLGGHLSLGVMEAGSVKFWFSPLSFLSILALPKSEGQAKPIGPAGIFSGAREEQKWEPELRVGLGREERSMGQSFIS